MTESHEPSSPATPNPPGSSKPVTTPQDLAKERGPIRNTLESFGMAVLLAILLKYFFLEAYVIPTPSMQPTMMGAPEADESDRILVDKSYYVFHDPKRWDIAVFRYPLRKIQSYVKRIVGIGGDRIRIAGGNLNQVSADGKTLTILRKPLRIQDPLWREIYPMRRKLVIHEASDEADYDAVPSKSDVFNNTYFRTSRAWDIDPDNGDFLGKPNRAGRLRLEAGPEEARNNKSDGYDLGVARVQRAGDRQAEFGAKAPRPEDFEAVDRRGGEAVTDLRIGFTLTPAAAVDELRFAIQVEKLGIRYALTIKDGKGTLSAERTKGATKKLNSEAFDFAIAPGEATPIRFARLDDMLYAWRDGDIVGEFDVSAIPIHQRLDFGDVRLATDFTTKGDCRLADVRLERDLHYTLAGLETDHIIEVPADHFFMMGDNTLGSEDGRHWTAFKIGVDDDGNIVDPSDPKNKSARVLWGNRRPQPRSKKPHDDDNPVPLNDGRVVFVDEVGQFHSLKGKVEFDKWGYSEIRFVGAKNSWVAETKKMSFVPRRHIQGRPVARFLRSPSRLKFLGWIR